jgi:hypothetical protein
LPLYLSPSSASLLLRVPLHAPTSLIVSCLSPFLSPCFACPSCSLRACSDQGPALLGKATFLSSL